jgi:WD40 repeat protein
MNRDPMDMVLAEWLDEGPEQGPVHALERALAATRRVDQRRGWTFPSRWVPGPVVVRDTGAFRLTGVALLLVALLLALVTLAIATGGTRPRVSSLLGPSVDGLVAFQSGTAVAVSRIDGSAHRTLSADVPYARSPSFSPDGARVAFLAPSTPDGLGGRLWVAPVAGSGRAVDVGQGREVVPTSVPSVAWSPDGQRIAFASVDGGVATIYVALSDGSGVTPITDGAADRDLPTWSPDGERIAFRETDLDGLHHRLRTMRPDGTDVQEVDMAIAPDASLSKPRWAPDELSMSYMSNVGYGAQTRAVISLGYGHVAVPWTDGIGGLVEYGMPWSPDGRYLAILTATDGVIVADNDNTSPYDGSLRRLGDVAACWVDWSPDSTALYGGSPGGCDHVVVIPLADPSAAVALPESGSGVASWQPLPPP